MPSRFIPRLRGLLAPSLLSLLCGLSAQAQVRFEVSPKGLDVNAGAAGVFTLVPPGLTGADGKREQPVYADGVVRYASGATITYVVSPDGVSASLVLKDAPAGAKNLRFALRVPMAFNQGGLYALDSAAPKPLPVEFGDQWVEQGNGKSFTLVASSGSGFTLGTPGGWHGLQDSRKFNWSVFEYIYQFDFGGKTEAYVNFTVAPSVATGGVVASAVAKPAVRVVLDRYGQSVRKDYPGKVKSDDELKADVTAQRAALGAYTGPALDAFGGLAGSGEEYGLRKTGFFHVGRAGDRQVLVTPEGNVFFQLAACGIVNTDDYTTVKGREGVYEWLPERSGEFATAWRPHTPGALSFYIANWIRKFGKPYDAEEWSGQVVERLRAWGFNSSGAFSVQSATMNRLNFPYVRPLPNVAGVKMLPDRLGAGFVIDPFAPGNEEKLSQGVAKELAERAADPLLIGYYLGNEQHFENIPKLVPTYKASAVPAKRALVELLEKKYAGIEAFNRAWNPARPFAAFDELGEEPLFVRTDAAAADMQAFYEQYLEKHFALLQRVIRRHDANHLILGSRFTPATAGNEAALRISGKYTDVVTINYYTYGIEKAFLDRAHRVSGGRPIILSEWYYSSGEQGLSAHREVRDQRERGLAYRNYIEQSAALPHVVGSQWFIYMDQSITGRFFEGFNGEGNNTGFVNVADRPYEELVAAARLTHGRVYDVMLGREKPYLFDDPRFADKGGVKSGKVVSVPRALPGVAVDGTTRDWPGRPAEPVGTLALGTPNPDLRGDFRLCWDDENLYLHIQVKDPTPLRNDRPDAGLWGADGVELFIGARDLDQGGTLRYSDRQVLLGGTSPARLHIVDHPDAAAKCRVVTVKDVSGDGYALAAALPWPVLGIEPKPGMELLFDVAIDNSDDGLARKQQLVWAGSAKNSGDRGSWGRARLTEN